MKWKNFFMLMSIILVKWAIIDATIDKLGELKDRATGKIGHQSD